jgi:hypothetical protein
MQTKGRYGYFKKTVFSFVFFTLLLFSAFCSAEELLSVDLLVEQAVNDKLHEDDYWHILLHYKKGLSGIKSLIDDPEFFLSKSGKNDPLSELEATIRSFFQEDKEKAEEILCRFAARYFWLKDKLEFNISSLPYDGCEAFDATVERLKPESAVLIFPSAYINSPASMFGHTLIRIDSAENSRLLSSAVNYAATGDDINGLLFAFKGIFGLYRGYFSILPYYKKVKEYGDLDHRDMWEYRLDLSLEEVNRMMLHLWELQEIYSDYFFFDENCSYTLLFLLDAARPELKLTDSCAPWVIPISTIRVVAEKGLIKDVVYRPSKSTKIKHLIASTDEKTHDLVAKIYDGESVAGSILKEGLTSVAQARTLDLVMEYSQYKYSRNELTKEKYFDIFLSASKTRSRLKNVESYIKDIDVPSRPEKGHKPNRIGIGFGVLKGADRGNDNAFFQEISIRPAYHDLLSDDRGYVKGSQIEFMNLVLRYFPDQRKTALEKLDIINIVSISERDKFFKPVSWKVDTGFFRQSLPGGKRALFYKLSFGGGYAWNKKLFGTIYLMADSELDVSGRIKNSFCFGLGGTAGILKEISSRYKIHLFVRPLYFMLGDTHTGFEWKASQQVSITANTAVSLDFSGKDSFGYYESESMFCFHVYF